MKSAVIVFPASNCDRDIQVALRDITGHEPDMIWHGETSLGNYDLVVLPGGFSYGDYLRCGAMAAKSPIMSEVKRHADQGRLLMGICNGFQVLTESHLLPGALMCNKNLKFICKKVHLKIENTDTPFTRHYQTDTPIHVPVAHHDGNFVIDEDGLKALNDNNQVLFRYCEADGTVTDTANINGSAQNIAGILNKQGNVMGLMPHPERAVDPTHGGTDGMNMFKGLMEAFA